MIKNRIVAAGAAAALATGTALMAAPAQAAEATPAPTVGASTLPIQVDFDCLKNNAHERHQIESKIAKILIENGTAKAKAVAIASAKEIVKTVLENPGLLIDQTALVTTIVKIVAHNALEAFGDSSDLGDLKPLAKEIIANLKNARVCFTVNLPGQPGKTERVGHLGDVQTAAWVPADQVR
ncbi:hypothetical protein JMX53_03195 [Cutibacterium avidum]|uniref:hypothetical protein n=1 Tax=Cutibacterium avidum TaxID=33010 RepID=UPI00192C7FD5|nr:hypothetical protein [Cutibacterium avidum]QQY15584.1 hypothetical protein JMX53_03195 [Cutibacterium avidum]